MVSYRQLPPGELEKRAEKAFSLLADCTVCAQECHINRLDEEFGVCRGGKYAAVSSYGPHFGEEPPLVGSRGSGTIFFTFCNLKCKFCQNYDISQRGEGYEISSAELAKIMLGLQESGCHNVNLVSPSHFVPQFLKALAAAGKKGLNIPVVYNTGGYDSVKTLALLDGVVDIYMPDIKYGDDEQGRKYSGVDRYFSVAAEAVKTMHRQVGDLLVDEDGIAVRGLLVRHLVLPENLARTDKVAKFLAEEVSENTYINIMDQYNPAYKARNFPELNRPITAEEYRQALEYAKKAGLKRIYYR